MGILQEYRGYIFMGIQLLNNIHIYLVGGWATPLKNISQLGLFPIYGQIKMFQTTNHMSLSLYIYMKTHMDK